MRFFKGLVAGVLLGAGSMWLFQESRRNAPQNEAEIRFRDQAARAIDAAGEAAYHLGEALWAKLEALDLLPDDVMEELARKGSVVRRKPRDSEMPPPDPAADARIALLVRQKFTGDVHLSLWDIGVTCGGGHVVISGTVPSPELVSKAVVLAMETPGVRKVTSTLAVLPSR